MKTRAVAALAAAAALTATPLLLTTVAGAGTIPTYDVTPFSGPAGTVVTASGAGCFPEDGFEVFVYWTPADAPVEGGEPFFEVINTPGPANEDGTFVVTATIPLDAPVGTGSIGVQCIVPDGGGQATQHFPFQVTATPQSTTTTTTSPAVAAQGVTAAPAFTG